MNNREPDSESSSGGAGDGEGPGERADGGAPHRTDGGGVDTAPTPTADGAGGEEATPTMQDFSEYEVLEAVQLAAENAPVCTPSEVAERLDATGSGLLRRFNRLVHAGYLHRKTVGGSAIVLWLTDRGRAVLRGDLPEIQTSGYPTTVPPDTVDESVLQRRPGYEGRLDMVEPLELLRDAEGPVCTAGDLAAAFDVSHTAVLKRLNKLARIGAVGRKPCGATAVVWWLTPAGEAVLDGRIPRDAAEAKYREASSRPPEPGDDDRDVELRLPATRDGGAVLASGGATTAEGDAGGPALPDRDSDGDGDDGDDELSPGKQSSLAAHSESEQQEARDGMAGVPEARRNEWIADREAITRDEPRPRDRDDDAGVAEGRVLPHPDDSAEARYRRLHHGTPRPAVPYVDLLATVRDADTPAVTAGQLAEATGVAEQTLRKHINRLVHAKCLHLKDTGAAGVYWLTTRGEQAVKNGGKNLARHVLLGYPDTAPEPTVDDSDLERPGGAEGPLSPFEPLGLLRRAQGPVCSAAELGDAAGLSRPAMLNRLHKLHAVGLVEPLETGGRAIAWSLTDKGLRAYHDAEGVDAEALREAYREASAYDGRE